MSSTSKMKSKQSTNSKNTGKLKYSKEEYERLLNSLKEETATSPQTKTSSSHLEWPNPVEADPSEEMRARSAETEQCVARAKQLQLEQEDEIKVANKLILATKCQAIRDAQMSEKQRIQRELEAEDSRLEREMEEMRVRALQQQARRRDEQQQKRTQYARELGKQVQDNERHRQICKEKAARESEKLRELHRQRESEEAAAAQSRAAEQRKIKQELARMNQAMQHRRVMELAHEKMANLRIQQYMVGKAAREAERQQRRERLRQAQEREVARLRALQQRQQEVRDRALSELIERDQELVAREWRTKELEAAKRRVEMEEKLREARVKQAEERRRLHALAVQREEQRTAEEIALQAAETEKERSDLQRRQEAAGRYRRALEEQMRAKEEERRLARAVRAAEAQRVLQEQRAHELELRGALHHKVHELRNFRVPEKYVAGVERQLGIKANINM